MRKFINNCEQEGKLLIYFVGKNHGTLGTLNRDLWLAGEEGLWNCQKNDHKIPIIAYQPPRPYES